MVRVATGSIGLRVADAEKRAENVEVEAWLPLRESPTLPALMASFTPPISPRPGRDARPAAPSEAVSCVEDLRQERIAMHSGVELGEAWHIQL